MKRFMERLDSRLEDLSDLFNPQLVRETRQSLRSNAFAYCVVVASALFSLALICGVFNQTFSGPGVSSMKTGSYVFNFIFFALWLINCLVLPFAATQKATEEARGGEFELFAATGASSWSIALGKLEASLLQTILLSVLAAPFLLACLLLRGVSTPDILLYLAGMLFQSACLTQLGILLGCLKLSRTMHSLLSLGFVGAIFWLFFFCMLFMNARNVEIFSRGPAMVFAFFLGPLLYGTLGFLATVATLDSQNKDRAFPLKATLLLAVALTPFAAHLVCHDKNISSITLWMLTPILALAATLTPCARLAKVPHRSFELLPKRLGSFGRALFGPALGSTTIWLSATMLVFCFGERTLSIRNSGCDDSNGTLAVILSALAFWAFAGNLPGFFFRKANPLALSLAGLITPCVAAAVLAFTSTSSSEAARFVFPLSLPSYLAERDKLWLGQNCAFAFWGLLLIAGIVLHALKERKANSQPN